MLKRSSKPKKAKAVKQPASSILDETPKPHPTAADAMHSAAVALWHIGGRKGAKARVESLQKKKRSTTAKKAAKSRRGSSR